jgi:hypothetical protein
MFSDLASYYYDLIEEPCRLSGTAKRNLMEIVITPGIYLCPPRVEALFRVHIFN